MQIGKLDTRLSLYASCTWVDGVPTWPLLGRIWARVVDAKAAGRETAVSIYAAGSSLIETHAGRNIQVGYLLHNAKTGWFVVEDSLVTGGKLVISARRLSGEAATYYPREGNAYAMTAYLSPENALVGEMNELRHMIDLVQPELTWPWCRAGDVIALRGRRYRIVSTIEGSDNGVTRRVAVT